MSVAFGAILTKTPSGGPVPSRIIERVVFSGPESKTTPW